MFSANVENSDRPAIKVQRFRLTYGRSGESSPGAHASSQIFHPQRKTFLRRVCVCVRADVCFSSLGYICEVKLSSWQLQAADQRTPSCLSSRLLLEEAAEDGKKDEPEPGDIRTFFFFTLVGGRWGDRQLSGRADSHQLSAPATAERALRLLSETWSKALKHVNNTYTNTTGELFFLIIQFYHYLSKARD